MPTAEEAAALNLQWRAVNAPSTVTSAEQAQAQQYSNQYYNVERPAQQARDAAIQQTVIANRQMIDRQEGWNPSGAHTQEQLAAHYGNADLGRQAYSSEQDYYRANPSAAFQREINNANYQQNRIVTGNGSYRATGELKLNTTAGEGGYTGRAAEYKAAFDRQVYGIGAPNNEQEYYRRQAEREVVERPGYTTPANLGDTRTQQIRQGYGAFQQAMGIMGNPVASDYQMTGRIIEAQRQGAYATPERRDERFFMGELQKWAEIPVEKSSAYHHIGMESGKAIPANPYEYQGDLAVEFLKGAPQKSSEFFSPVSGEMSKYLPGGLGAQQFAWNEAITDYKRQNVDARTPYPEKVSFMEGVKYLGAAEGKYGPYGKLAGGIDNGGVDLTSGRLVGSGMVGGAGVTGSDGALPAPFKSTSTPSAATVSAQNEYKPSGLFGLGGLLPEMPTKEQFSAWVVAGKSKPLERTLEVQNAIVSSAVSVVQGFGSAYSSGLTEFIPGMKPTPIVEGTGSTKSVKTESFELPTTRDVSISNLPSSSKMSGGNQTITDLGTWLDTNYGNVDRTNPTAVKEYNDKADTFKQMQVQNPVFVTVTGGTKETVTEKGGTRIVTTETGSDSQKIYASEWDKFVEGSGRVGRWLTGETEAKQKAYFETIKNEEGIVGEAKRGLFYIGTEVINKPAALVPAAAAGATLAGASSMAPSFLAEVGAGTGITARGAQFLITPGGASLARAATVGVFGGLYTYGVTDKFTATPEETKENIYRSVPALVAMYGGAGGFNWVGETSLVKGVSSPAGATFSGVKVRDAYFGGGKTPTGQRYAGAFSPTESYVFTRGTAQPSATPTRAPQQLKLTSGSDAADASTYPSSFEGPARDYAHMDISGVSRPFSMKTAPETQYASTAKFRDTSGKASPFTVKTQAEPVRPTKPVVTEVIGDFSGKAQPFTMKTAAEVKAGVWDTAELIGGDTSPVGRRFSVQTENEYLSGLPRDTSGKAESFSIKTMGEVVEAGEKVRSDYTTMQGTMQWAREAARGNVRPGQDLTNRRVPSGFMDTLIDTEASLRTPSASWKKWTPQAQAEPAADYNPLNPKRGYAYAPAQEHVPFTVKGASESALSAELANMHPAFREQFGMTGDSLPFTIKGVSDTTLRAELQRVHPAYRDEIGRGGETLEERGYPYTQFEREGMGRQRDSAPSTQLTEFVTSSESPSQRKATLPVTIPRTVTGMEGWEAAAVGIALIGGTQYVTRTKSPGITEITIPYQKPSEKVIPYSRTTVTEKTTPKTSELVKDYPYEKITETPKPYERIIPVGPVPVVPIVGIPLGGLGSGGGGGGGHRGRRRRKVELFSFEMAEDTPIPTRFGLGGQVTEFVPGTRGLAIDILKRSDIAPNRLFEMGGDSSDHL